MRNVPIEEISIDAKNHLLIRPRLKPTEDFAHIYRTASGVIWVETARSLGAREPQKWEHLELFNQILSAVKSEYGQSLVITNETSWLNVPSELQKDLKACA